MLGDGANVIGARPTGWWRDRAGAARRFADAVRESVRDGRIESPVVLVFEGQARAGVDEADGDPDGVQVVHASGEGDDTIIALARDHGGAVVVTADRALAERVRALGAEVRGPRWFLDQLER
jgi:uncharacterized protein YaiI (UPF0178 family)